MAEIGFLFIYTAIPLKEHVARCRGRCSLSIINKDVAVFLSEMDQHKAATTNIARPGEGDRESKAAGDRGVDSIAAFLEDGQSGLRCQLFRADHHIAPPNVGDKAHAKIDKRCIAVVTFDRHCRWVN